MRPTITRGRIRSSAAAPPGPDRRNALVAEDIVGAEDEQVTKPIVTSGDGTIEFAQATVRDPSCWSVPL